MVARVKVRVPKKVFSTRVSLEVLEFLNSLENRNKFVLQLIRDSQSFKLWQYRKSQEKEDEPSLFQI